MTAIEVTFDDQIFTTQPRGGVSRYFVELFAQLEAPELGIEARTPFRYVVNEHLLDRFPDRFRRPPVPRRLQRAQVAQLLNRIRGRREVPGILHHTYFDRSALARPARRRVCTVYDMIPELYPEEGVTHGAWLGKDEFVHACDAVLCISQTTKDDVRRHYGDLDKPVVVTPLGASERFFRAEPRAGAEPYVLYVGHRFSYKNFDLVLRGIARSAEEGRALPLQCVGGPPFDEAERARVAELEIAHLVRWTVADDDELPVLYAGATCLVFPSRREGFGLPIVEAFAAGCPVVAVDMPCSTEVGGDAAQYVGADDDAALAAALQRLARDAKHRDGAIAAGRVRARDFTWRRTAEATAAAYRELAG